MTDYDFLRRELARAKALVSYAAWYGDHSPAKEDISEALKIIDRLEALEKPSLEILKAVWHSGYRSTNTLRGKFSAQSCPKTECHACEEHIAKILKYFASRVEG